MSGIPSLFPANAGQGVWRTGYGEHVNLANNELRHHRVPVLLQRAMGSIDPSLAHAYPDYLLFRKLYADSLSVAEESVVLTAGSDQGYRAVLQCFAGADARILTQDPNYSQIFKYADQLGIDIVRVRYSDGGFDIQLMLKSMNQMRPGDLVLVSNPNGPSGLWWDPVTLRMVVEHASNRELFLLVDEAYAVFADDRFNDWDEHDHVIVLRSLSKSHGIAGARVGLAVCGSAEVAGALQSWNVTNPVSGLSLELGLRLLEWTNEFETIWGDLRRSREALREGLARALGATAISAQGNFATFRLDAGSERVNAVVGRLAQRGYAVRDLARLGMPGYLRITAADPATTAGVIAAVRGACDEVSAVAE